MNYSDIKYDQANRFIQSKYEEYKDWDEVKKLTGISEEEKRIILEHVCKILDVSEWEALVEHHKSKGKKTRVSKLGKDVFNDAILPTYKYTAWQTYKQKLKKSLFSADAIQTIETDSFEILKNLSPNTQGKPPIKGLVMGNVQSGKTANMAGLMAMAADNGFNFFIVLSGTIENLRKQTANRLHNDLKSNENGFIQWEHIENPSKKLLNVAGYNISEFQLNKGANKRYFSVCLKNGKRLRDLTSWLLSDENKAKQLKVLIIDDEADQASINTANLFDNSDEEREYSTIHKLIYQLAHTDKVKAMNYVAYTATPYGNILNDSSEDSLYPSDFIYLLEQSSDYIGPKEMFGIESPENSPAIDICRYISEIDLEIIKDLHEKEGNILPTSLKTAIQWFLITLAIQRNKGYKKPVTMLIHTSFKIDHHEIIALHVESYLGYIQKNYEKVIKELETLFVNESADFNENDFLNGMPYYSATNDVLTYPDWSDIEKQLKRLVNIPSHEFCSHIFTDSEGEPTYHKGVHLIIDNSKTKVEDQIVRLEYPTKEQSIASAFIVIGGNTLSRGLTLEGLTTSYFVRNTKQADTLMQMARWFGYRKGYEILPRVWLDNSALLRYEYLSQMNEELREELRDYAITGMTPRDCAPRIRNSADYQLIRVTSSNKMQSAKGVEFDFSGFNSQTIYFENNFNILKSNYDLTKSFLNQLPKPWLNGNKLVWKDVTTKEIKQFLQEYNVYKEHFRMANLHLLIGWMEENDANLQNWSVIFSGVELRKATNENWNIHGYTSKPSVRTKLSRSTPEVFNIGALRSPLDLLGDIKGLDIKEENSVAMADIRGTRKRYHYEDVPQLLIYLIDKNSKAKKGSVSRKDLNLPHDAIGINVMIPGQSKSSDLATYLSADIVVPNEDDTEFYEE